jgi:hypothetical protein
VYITDACGKGNGESVRKSESEQPFGLSISVNTVLFTSSLSVNVALEENAVFQFVINDVLCIHNCDMDDVNVDDWICGAGFKRIQG